MRLLDWLFERKRVRESLREDQRLIDARNAVIESGNDFERDGLLVCPHCGYKVSQQDVDENRRMFSGLPEALTRRAFSSVPSADGS